VLCETARALMHVARKEFGREVVFKEISSFNIAISFDLTAEQVEHTMTLVHEPDVLLSMEPIPGARRLLEQWIGAGFIIEIVTGRPPSTAAPSHAWLKKHEIPYSALVFVNKYGREHPDTDSISYISLNELRTREYRLAIDDSPEMAAFLANEMNMDLALFDRPWNAGAVLPSSSVNRRIERCRGWAEIAAKFALELEPVQTTEP